MTDIIVLVIIGLIIGCAAGYVYKEKKRGVKCIGCPDGGSCSGCCGCGGTEGSCGCGGSGIK